jgi:hypothetical protein
MDQVSITKTVKKPISEGSLQVQNQNCTGSQLINIKTQSNKKIDSSVTFSEEDQITGKLKIDKLIPDIREEIKKKVDKKLQDVKKKVEEKRQEIQQKLDGMNKDTSQSKDANKLEQKKSQKMDTNSLVEELKERIKDRLKSKLSIQTFPFP